ncbi:MAG: hypothetical protein MUC89_05035 [Acetobacteraceae bacterium]|jgi:hypothetical protein|nr:hypothetical protein [Acetobacteraceae bacterium]
MWTIVNGPRGAYDNWSLISDDGKKKWQMFQRLIQKEHIHPKAAAQRVGTVAHKAAMGYEHLEGTVDQHTIRLDGARRASFRVQETATGGTVTVLQVGGHSKSKK